MSELSTRKKNFIRALWRKPGFPGAFTGLTTFRTALALEKDIHISRTNLFHIMKHDEHFVVETKRRRKQIPRRPLVVHGFCALWQADLAAMPEINGYIGFLCCIDLFSRNIYCRLLRSKTAKEVRKAFLDIFREVGQKPQKLETDKGSEFLGNRAFFIRQQIFFKIKVGQNKAAFCENAIQVRKHLCFSSFGPYI